jgi:hypothetical protein
MHIVFMSAAMKASDGSSRKVIQAVPPLRDTQEFPLQLNGLEHIPAKSYPLITSQKTKQRSLGNVFLLHAVLLQG